MKIAFCLAILGFAALALAEPSRRGGDRTFAAFMEFTHEFEKTYATPEELEYRYGVYLANQVEIDELNADPEDPAVYGNTEFSDWTEEEFEAWLGFGSPEDLVVGGHFIPPMPAAEAKARIAANGGEWDWREHGIVGEIKNQGQCGSCWAFSTIASIEGQYALAHDQLIEFSEQQLVDCDPKSNGCRGGFMHWAYQSILADGGLMTAAEYPYKGRGGSCSYTEKPDNIQLTGYNIHCAADKDMEEEVKTDPCDTDDMLGKIPEVGTLAIAVNAKTMQFYRHGVMKPSKRKCNPDKLSHAVALIGYGTEGSDDYWLVRNSWGTRWGEKGYCKYARQQSDKLPKDSCGIMSVIMSSVVA